MFPSSPTGLAHQRESGERRREAEQQGAAEANILNYGDESSEFQSQPGEKSENKCEPEGSSSGSYPIPSAEEASLLAPRVDVTHRREQYGRTGSPAQ